jgi:RimJ/RimL family protein N-acetyltransferase
VTLLPADQAIESDRLMLRRLTPDDLEFFVAAHQDDDVARYIGTGHLRPRAETEGWLQDILDSYANADLGQLAVVRKADGMLIGRCGLSDAAIEREPQPGQLRKGWFFSVHVPAGVDVMPLPELGYTFAKAHWGQGYASEAAGCVFDYVCARRSFPAIMSVIHAGNAASRAVAHKFGVTYVDDVEMAGRAFERYHWPLG